MSHSGESCGIKGSQKFNFVVCEQNFGTQRAQSNSDQKKNLDEIVFTVKFSTRIYSNDCRNYRVEMFERDQSVFLRGTKQTRVTRNQTAPKSL